MPKIQLTDISIRALKPPAKGQTTYWDKSLAGFGVRVSPGGAKTFVLVHGATRQRTTIGRHSVISLADARTEAKRILAELTLGKARPTRISFDEAKSLFLAAGEQRNRPRTVADYRRLLGRHLPFGRTQLSDIRPQDIERRLDQLKGVPSEAQHALVASKIFFRWCVRRGYLDHSPCERLESRTKTISRERVLSDEELGKVFARAASTSYPFGPIVMLLILTGQRRGEIVSLKWSYINTDDRTITLPVTLTKNRRQHTFPYGQSVAGILDAIPRREDYLFPASREHVRGKPTTVFNGWPKAKAELDKKLDGNDPWTLHDLRRTFSSGLAALGVPQIVVEKLLNHVSGGTLSPIAQVYNRHSYLQEMRAAQSTWETKVNNIGRPYR